MSDFREPVYESDEFRMLLQKYEKLRNGTISAFFDVEEFEQIIDYFLDDFEFEEANKAAELGSSQHPASVEIKYKIVHIHIEQGKSKKALSVLNEIPAWEHANSEFHFLTGTALCLSGKHKEAERSFDHALSIATDDVFDALINISIAFENARHFKLAIKYLKQALELSPDSLSVLYDLGYFHERVYRYEDSIDFYNKYLDIDPFSENVWYNLGVVLFKLKQYRQAIEAYDYSIALNPDYASAYFNKANAWASLDRYDKAAEAFLEFIEIETDNTQAICYLGDCYEHLGRYDEALVAYKQVIEIDNTDAEGWFGAGMIYYHNNAYKEAIAYILKALEFDKKNLDYWLNLGYIYEEAGMNKEAISCFKHVTLKDPDDREAWMGLSSLMLQEGMFEKVIPLLREAYTHFSRDENVAVKLAVAHIKNGNQKLGISFLKRALSISDTVYTEFEYYIPAHLQDPDIREIINKYKS